MTACRRSIPAACNTSSAEPSGSAPVAFDQLRIKLEAAVDREDYAEAATLRDQLRSAM